MLTQLRLLSSFLLVLCLAKQIYATPIGYILLNSDQTLASFDLANPSLVTIVGSFSGDFPTVSSIDFRVSDGLLYGISANSYIVTVDTRTSDTNLVSVSNIQTTVITHGIDFNPVADRLRVVNTVDQNLRINVATGMANRDGFLTFADGDSNFGADRNVIEAAYTNNDNSTATGTSLYYIDHELDALLTTSDPNSGVLNTIGRLGFGRSGRLGFDIFTDGSGVNTAYVVRSVLFTNNTHLYRVNLSTGAATDLGRIGIPSGYSYSSGLAIAPITVPEPSTMVIGFCLAALSLINNYRRVRLVG